MELLQLVFKNFWTFIGSFLLLGVIVRGIVSLIHGHECKDSFNEKEIVAVYKLGKIDGKNGHHINDDQVIDEIKTILKDRKWK